MSAIHVVHVPLLSAVVVGPRFGSRLCGGDRGVLLPGQTTWWRRQGRRRLNLGPLDAIFFRPSIFFYFVEERYLPASAPIASLLSSQPYKLVATILPRVIIYELSNYVIFSTCM